MTELDYAEGGVRVRIIRGAGPPPGPARVVQAGPAADVEPGRAAAGDIGPGAGHTLLAGMPGTFYRAPAPGQTPFVSVGDRVEDGQTLAILEAMKMLNPVEADRAGRIVRILVEDGAAVDAGTPLFELED